jgi:hypothetical protein
MELFGIVGLLPQRGLPSREKKDQERVLKVTEILMDSVL